MKKLKYYLMQLLPLRYNTIYSEPESEIVYVAQWRMWFGRVWAHEVRQFRKL